MAKGVTSPCNGCTRRAVGCHNPETCEDWKNYLEEMEKKRAWLNEQHIINGVEGVWRQYWNPERKTKVNRMK